MASAAAEYRRSRTYAPVREREQVRVLPGQRSDAALSPVVVSAAKAIVAVALLIALACIARVALSTASVQALMETRQAEAATSEQRAWGADLRIAQGAAASPTALKDRASDLGMAPATDSAMVSLSDDVVGYSDSGSLSLARTIENVASRK